MNKIPLIIIPIIGFIFIINFAKADTYLLGWSHSTSGGAGGNNFYSTDQYTNYSMTIQTDKQSYNKGEDLNQIITVDNISSHYYSIYSGDTPEPVINESWDPHPEYINFSSKNIAVALTSFGKTNSTTNDIQMSGGSNITVINGEIGGININAYTPNIWVNTITLPLSLSSGEYYSNRMLDYSESTISNPTIKTYSNPFILKDLNNSTNTSPRIFIQ